MDYEKYLQILDAYKDRYHYFLYAYILMANHVHLLIETQDTPLSKILQGINQTYTMYFNRKYMTVGHLFQGRYKAILCDRDAYLLALVKYIHQNSIRAKIANTVGGYRWSSHLAYAGKAELEGLVDTDLVLGLFSKRKGVARRGYLEFMELGQSLEREDIYATVDQRIKGSEEFAERILRKCGDEGLEKRIGVKRYSLSQIAGAVERLYGLGIEELRSSGKTRQVSFGRRVFSLTARGNGYRGNEVAEYLNKDPAVVTLYARGSEELSGAVNAMRRYLNGRKSQ